MSREIFFGGTYEPLEQQILASVLRPGMHFIDVGANRGYFTLFAADLVGAAGRVLALEPDPRMYDLLVRAVRKSNLAHVTTLPLAAGAISGTAALVGFAEGDGNFGVSKLAGGGHSDCEQFSVTVRRLDDILAEERLEDVDLLKMDIEGYEGFAIAGLGKALTDRRIDRLLVEFHPAELVPHGQSADDIMKTLGEFGYRGWSIDHSAGAYRAAAYGRGRLREFVRPIAVGKDLGRWPHTFWVRHGIDWSPD
jgi:FkbM family methyltransferase